MVLTLFRPLPARLDIDVQIGPGEALQAHHWPLIWGYVFGSLGIVLPLSSTSWVFIPEDLPRELRRRDGEAWVLSTVTWTALPRLRPLFEALKVHTLHLTIRRSGRPPVVAEGPCG